MHQQIHPKPLPHYQRILYVTDGSVPAQEAGRHAVFLAQRSQAQLFVLCVFPDSITRRISSLLRQVVGEERRLAKKAVEEIVELATASGVKATAVVEAGRRMEAIGRAASRLDADLIVVSSAPGEDLKTIFGQGTSEATPLWADRPVCVIMC